MGMRNSCYPLHCNKLSLPLTPLLLMEKVNKSHRVGNDNSLEKFDVSLCLHPASVVVQVTNLQVQLDNASMELAAKDHTIQTLTEQCNTLVRWSYICNPTYSTLTPLDFSLLCVL